MSYSVLINVKRHEMGSIVYFPYTRRPQRSFDLNRTGPSFIFGAVEFTDQHVARYVLATAERIGCGGASCLLEKYVCVDVDINMSENICWFPNKIDSIEWPRSGGRLTKWRYGRI